MKLEKPPKTYKVTSEQLTQNILASCDRIVKDLDVEIPIDIDVEKIKELQRKYKVNDFLYDLTKATSNEITVILEGLDDENDLIELINTEK